MMGIVAMLISWAAACPVPNRNTLDANPAISNDIRAWQDYA